MASAHSSGTGKLWYAATVLLVLQMSIVVTGGLVRVTGSGLGCPTWPKCTQDSFIPDESQSPFHSAIEFGNRLFTFALLVAAITTLLAAWKREDLRKLAALQVLGIFGQGILGGITVLTKLNPFTVASHLLLSMFLISGATSLQFKVKPFRRIDSNAILESGNKYSKALAIIAFLTIFAGTIVTGSGPHAGDWQAPRFNFELYRAAQLHSAFVVLTSLLALFIAAKFPRGIANWLLAVIIGQGLIGFAQWWQGLPQVLVGLHLVGVSLFWFTIWRTRISFLYQR
jgi:cytochrome c oxidase assembly protein subunit 15